MGFGLEDPAGGDTFAVALDGAFAALAAGVFVVLARALVTDPVLSEGATGLGAGFRGSRGIGVRKRIRETVTKRTLLPRTGSGLLTSLLISLLTSLLTSPLTKVNVIMVTLIIERGRQVAEDIYAANRGLKTMSKEIVGIEMLTLVPKPKECRHDQAKASRTQTWRNRPWIRNWLFNETIKGKASSTYPVLKERGENNLGIFIGPCRTVRQLKRGTGVRIVDFGQRCPFDD
jgi:hypothetical protein